MCVWGGGGGGGGGGSEGLTSAVLENACRSYL